jgi:hypothetical protein
MKSSVAAQLGWAAGLQPHPKQQQNDMDGSINYVFAKTRLQPIKQIPAIRRELSLLRQAS